MRIYVFGVVKSILKHSCDVCTYNKSNIAADKLRTLHTFQEKVGVFTLSAAPPPPKKRSLALHSGKKLTVTAEKNISIKLNI